MRWEYLTYEYGLLTARTRNSNHPAWCYLLEYELFAGRGAILPPPILHLTVRLYSLWEDSGIIMKEVKLVTKNIAPRETHKFISLPTGSQAQSVRRRWRSTSEYEKWSTNIWNTPTSMLMVPRPVNVQVQVCGLMNLPSNFVCQTIHQCLVQNCLQVAKLLIMPLILTVNKFVILSDSMFSIKPNWYRHHRYKFSTGPQYL